MCFVVSHNTMLANPSFFLPQYHVHHSILLSPIVPCSPFRYVVSHSTILAIPLCCLTHYHARHSVMLSHTVPCSPFHYVVSHSTMLTIPLRCLPQYHAHHSVTLSPTISCSPFRFAFPVLCSTNQVLKIGFSLFIMSSRKTASLRKDNILKYFDFFVFTCVSVCWCVFHFLNFS